MPSKPFFSSCRTSIQITPVLHCLANYFLTIPASTGHSLCKPGAAAAAAGVYGVVAWIAKQTLFFTVVFFKRKEPVQVPTLTRAYMPSPEMSPVAELATNPRAEMSVNTRDIGTRDFGLGVMQVYNIPRESYSLPHAENPLPDRPISVPF